MLDDGRCTVSFSRFDGKFVPCFADDGSLPCMIKNRFGHDRDCTFKIPEYNFFFIVYCKDIGTVFKMKRYYSLYFFLYIGANILMDKTKTLKKGNLSISREILQYYLKG